MDIPAGKERQNRYAPEQTANGAANVNGVAKPFIGINFKCCNVYRRIYKNKTENAYEGACPKCGKRVKLPIGKGGTDNRFFEAS